MHLTYQVTPDDEGQRAVDVLIRRTGMSRLMSKKIRLYGQLSLNGQAHRMVDPVKSGDVLVAIYNASPGQPDLREVPNVVVRFIDDWLLVVSKPAGMVTHPTFLHEKGSLTSLSGRLSPTSGQSSGSRHIRVGADRQKWPCSSRDSQQGDAEDLCWFDPRSLRGKTRCYRRADPAFGQQHHVA